MNGILEIITIVLAIAGFTRLIIDLITFLQESVWISLTKPEKVFKWQHIQIAKAAYFSAKKLRTVSRKNMKKDKFDKKIIDKADKINKEIVKTRKIMLDNIHRHGVNSTEFKALSQKTSELYDEYKETVENMK